MTSAAAPFIVAASGWAPPMPPRPADTNTRPSRLPPNLRRGERGERLEGALQDALAADVDPAAGRHLAVHRQALVLEVAEVLPRGPRGDQHRVRDQHAGCAGVGLEDPHGLARLDHQRLVGFERPQRAGDRVVARPVARGLARAAVDDQVVGPLGDVGVEVVHQHAQRGFLLPALAGEAGAARRANETGLGGHDQSAGNQRPEMRPRSLEPGAALST